MLISNHRSFWDYISYFYLFLFDYIRPVVSYEMYHKGRLLRFFLDMIGAIPLSENPLDFTWMETVISLLKKGKKVIIFPEAHFIQEDKLSRFYSSYVIIALRANGPILPLYTNGKYKSWQRNRIVIGEKINLSDLTTKGNLDHDERERLNETIKNKISYLSSLCKIRMRHHTFSFPYFLWDLGRFLVYIHFSWLLRPKFITYDGKKHYRRTGSYIIVSNHKRFMDPFVILCAFWRRRIKILAADVVFGIPQPHKVRSFFLRQAGVIKISRESLDLEAVTNCCNTLKNGFPVLIFPEGKIETTNAMSVLKNGTSMIASRSNVPILPMYISYRKRWYQCTKIYLGKEILPSKDKTMKGIEETTERMRVAMEELKEKAEKEI